MTTNDSRKPEAFLDTSYALALAYSADQFHNRALAVQEELSRLGVRVLTTRGVLLEIGNALSKARWRQAGATLIQAAEVDPTIQIEPWTEDSYKRALNLFCDRNDKEWGLVDCLSFVVMEEHGIRIGLTADEHFVQHGYRAVLREAGAVFGS